jgi:hypothetical protein
LLRSAFVDRIMQIDETGEVTEEASRVRLRLVLQDGKQPGSTAFSLPVHVGPVAVQHQARRHVGLYDKLIQMSCRILRWNWKNKRFESPEMCSRCQCTEVDTLFLVENGTGVPVCDACSTPPSSNERSSAQRIQVR